MDTPDNEMESQQCQESYWPSCKPENCICHVMSELPTVTVLLHGLLALSCNSRNECEVGILNTAYDHRLRVEIYEVPDCRWEGADWSDVPPKKWQELKWKLIYYNPVGWAGKLSRDIILDAVNPVVQNVRFHYFPKTSPEPKQNAYNFDKVIDLEDVYKEKLDKIPDAFKPKLHLRHGELYAFQETEDNFHLIGNNEKKDLGHLPRLIAAGICLKDDGYVSFKLDGHELRLYKDSGRQYLIIIANDCGCDSEKDAKKGDGDFFRYFEAVYPPLGKEKYDLVKYGLQVAVNDFAPCAGIGFGRSGGLP